ncbi:hypothetical protein GLYMA_11G221250v4 [Glycine max]|nr:hypothetical protein GLYMA_11G221250v4 [Glycine max]KAH1160297.1 hypothetical protein GYH30_031868 [Glycine max]
MTLNKLMVLLTNILMSLVKKIKKNIYCEYYKIT